MFFEHGLWKAYPSHIDPQSNEAIVRVAKGATEVAFVGVKSDGTARWAVPGSLFVHRGQFAAVERIVHEAAQRLWANHPNGGDSC